jgi:hypothetical protein
MASGMVCCSPDFRPVVVTNTTGSPAGGDGTEMPEPSPGTDHNDRTTATSAGVSV